MDQLQRIVDILTRQGYQAVIADLAPRVVIVQDPVACSSGGGRKWVEYVPVHIHNMAEFVRFEAVRS